MNSTDGSLPFHGQPSHGQSCQEPSLRGQDSQGHSSLGLGTEGDHWTPHALGAFEGLLAPALVLSFAAVLGGFASGAAAVRVTIGMIVLGLVACLGATVGDGRFKGLLDPLRLGAGKGQNHSGWSRYVGLLPWLVLASIVGSLWFSPVPRAGRLFLCYGPWLLLLVPAVRWSLRDEQRRRVGEVGFSCAVIVVASWALYDWVILGSPRAAMPLGHHNLLALWLVAMLPMAVLPSVWQVGERMKRGPGRLSGIPQTTGGSAEVGAGQPSLGAFRATVVTRRLGVAAAALGVLALLGSMSLAGAVGLCAQLLWVVAKAPGPQGTAVRRSRLLFGVASTAAILLVVGWRRVVALLGSGDQSMEARWLYLRAALEGWQERPIFGWGPGASSWTLGLHLDTGKLPLHQIVTDAHSLPLDLLYETGLVGLLGVGLVGWLWWRSPRRGSQVKEMRSGSAQRGTVLKKASQKEAKPANVLSSEASAWIAVSEVSLIGLAVTAMVAGFFDVIAVCILVPVLMGVRDGAEGDPCGPFGSSREAGTTTLRRRLVAMKLGAFALVASLAWVAVVPLRAHFAYERAGTTSDPRIEREALERAVRLDAEHPLFGMAWAQATGEGSAALRAASNARGLAPLFLASGYLVRDLEGSALDAREALERACDLAVGDPMAPFLLATLEEPKIPLREDVGAQEAGALQGLARSLVAEPRLLATPELLARPDIRKMAVRLLEHRTEIPIGWRAALVGTEARLPARAQVVVDPLDLVLYADESHATSLALFAFRRKAPRSVVARVTLDEALAASIDMPPAGDLGGFDVRLFASGCRLSAAGDT